MKLRNTAIALGIGAATATGLSLLKVNKDLVVGSKKGIIVKDMRESFDQDRSCLLYTSPSPRDGLLSRMPSSA